MYTETAMRSVGKMAMSWVWTVALSVYRPEKTWTGILMVFVRE